MSTEFNWDKYEETSNKKDSTFNWDDYEEAPRQVKGGADTKLGMAIDAIFGGGTEKALRQGISDTVSLGGIVPSALEAGVEKIKGNEKGLTDLYRELQDKRQAKAKQDEEASPIAYNVGKFGAMLPVGVAMSAPAAATRAAIGLGAELGLGEAAAAGASALASEAAKRAAVSTVASLPGTAVLSAAGAKDNLVGPGANPMGVAKEVGKDVAMSAGINAGLAGLGAAGAKVGQVASDFIADSPKLTQFLESFKRGVTGKGFSGTKNEQELYDQGLNKQARELAERLESGRTAFSNEIGEAFEAGEAAGVNFNVADDMNELLQNLSKFYGRSNPKIPNNIASLGAEYNLKSAKPQELYNLRSNLIKYQSVLPREDMEAKNVITKLADDLNNRLATDPIIGQRFKEASSGMAKYSQEVLDPFFGKKFSEVEDGTEKLTEAVEAALLGQAKTSKTTASTKSGKLMRDLSTTLDEVSSLPVGKKKIGEVVGTSEILSEPQKAARLDNIRLNIDGDEGEKIKTSYSLLKPLKSISLTGANVAGRGVSLGKSLTNFADEELLSASSRLSSNPNTKMLGDRLADAVRNKDTVAKNAVIFTILQKPDARRVIEENQD